jgi:hypothetical protein
MSRTRFSIWIQPWCLFGDWTTLFGNHFGNAWYRAYHICLGLIFQYEFNRYVCFVIGLPNLVISSVMLDMENIIYVQDIFFNANSTVMFVLWLDYLIWQSFHECLICNISYISRASFSMWIQLWCLFWYQTNHFGQFFVLYVCIYIMNHFSVWIQP